MTIHIYNIIAMQRYSNTIISQYIDILAHWFVGCSLTCRRVLGLGSPPMWTLAVLSGSSVLCSHLCAQPFGGVALQLDTTWIQDLVSYGLQFRRCWKFPLHVVNWQGCFATLWYSLRMCTNPWQKQIGQIVWKPFGGNVNWQGLGIS